MLVMSMASIMHGTLMEKILSEYIGKKIIDLEIDYYNIIISDSSLKEIIINDKTLNIILNNSQNRRLLNSQNGKLLNAMNKKFEQFSDFLKPSDYTQNKNKDNKKIDEYKLNKLMNETSKNNSALTDTFSKLNFLLKNL